MFAIVQNGQVTQIVQPHTAFKIGDKPFSNRYLVNATKEERLAEGIYEIIEGERKDERFYWVSPARYEVMVDYVQTHYDAKAKQLEDATETPEGATEPVTTKGLKSQWKREIRLKANGLMAETDWAVTRKIERDIPIPNDIAEERAGIIAECSRIVDAIEAAQDMDAFMAAINDQQWPDMAKKNWPN